MIPTVELIITALRAADQGARGTGRTQRMIEALRDDDVVVCTGHRHAINTQKHMHHLFMVAGGVPPKVTFVYCAANPHALLEAMAARPVRRLVFSHEWELAYFENMAKAAMNDLTSVTQAVQRNYLPRDQRQESIYTYKPGDIP